RSRPGFPLFPYTTLFRSWTALCDGWSVVRIAPDGAIDRVVGLPVPCPTDVAFGGVRGERLFVVSARDTLSMDALGAAPLSGRLRSEEHTSELQSPYDLVC